ncbi:hypothetical protein IV203_030681 [Nitzschia inconspicua]|uniref:Uncharacterized protein n=1 Tax=Nitzschia inconspicua TaxID=303405 RepID=A0A9K3LTY6_9STRA|nr:hypothetical protein IV203_030681 [Nitzschia inconspicua]
MILLRCLSALLLCAVTTHGFEFQHDFDPKKCAQEVEKCTTTNDMWYKCPISCSNHLEEEGAMAEERDDPEQFYHLTTTKSDGSPFSLEDNEGYVTLFAALPLLPGMAQYYYDAIEHIAQVYKYTLVPMIFPIVMEGNGNNSLDALPPKMNSKTILLENGSISNPVLQYLVTRQVVAGNPALKLTLDRPTIFLVSHTGMYIEQLAAPSMELMERRIKVHEWAMSKGDL